MASLPCLDQAPKQGATAETNTCEATDRSPYNDSMKQACREVPGHEGREQKRLLVEIEQLRALCAAAYQVAGACDASMEMLDNLWAAANGQPLPHDPLAGLPFVAPMDRS